MVVAFTEDEAKEIRDIAEGMRELAQQMLYNKTDMCGPCSPQEFLADMMEDDGNAIVTLSSRLLQLWNHKGLAPDFLHAGSADMRPDTAAHPPQSSAAQPAQPPQPELLRRLSTGEWYVHCKWCGTETRLEARNEEEAYGMLGGWQLSMPQLLRSHLRCNWSCPKCVDEYWKERDQRRSDRAGSAATDTPFDALKLEVVELKAKVVELEAEVERLRGEVHGHYAHARERDQEILDRALQMVRRESRRSAVPHDTRDAVDIAVPEEGEEQSTRIFST